MTDYVRVFENDRFHIDYSQEEYDKIVQQAKDDPSVQVLTEEMITEINKQILKKIFKRATPWKTKVYAITYNNHERINDNINKFFQSTENLDKEQYEFEYYVINNHSLFDISDNAHRDKVKVLHNSLRPDNSCGHLSRDYNAAIMHGFGSLSEPQCDQLVTVHDDTLWRDGWFDYLQEYHKKYTFYAGDYGCSMISYLPEAVKKIGMWDERFCNIGYHEADYFLRALIYNGSKSTINDEFGGRTHNRTGVLFEHPGPNHNKQQHYGNSLPYHPVSRKIFQEKWGRHPEQWGELKDLPSVSLIPNYVLYPYFEKDIEDLKEKNYTIEWDWNPEWDKV